MTISLLSRLQGVIQASSKTSAVARLRNNSLEQLSSFLQSTADQPASGETIFENGTVVVSTTRRLCLATMCWLFSMSATSTFKNRLNIRNKHTHKGNNNLYFMLLSKIKHNNFVALNDRYASRGESRERKHSERRAKHEQKNENGRQKLLALLPRREALQEALNESRNKRCELAVLRVLRVSVQTHWPRHLPSFKKSLFWFD